MDKFQAIFPSKPQGVSIAAYDAWVNNGQCARLLRGECESPCTAVSQDGRYHVDFDHITPKSKGGSDHQWNLEPKCLRENRVVKRDNLDESFLRPSFFDNKINPLGLRANQFTYGYNLVKTAYREIFSDPNNKLQDCYILLAWIVGSGKSLGMSAILHAINEVISDRQGSGAKRIKKVLWLVHQESLVRSIKDEVANEPCKYGILEQKPNVAMVQKAEHWNVAIAQADYVFACTQSLWSTKNSSLTDAKRKEYLSRFDAIVIDECHYGVERYIEILNAAPTCLKFVMSATPCDAKGQFLSEVENSRYRHLFRLFSVFGYQSARKEGYVKELLPWQQGLDNLRYVPVSGGDSHFVENGQVVNGEYNTKIKHNSPRANAIIKTAIDIAESNPLYPSHVMVRCESIVRLKSFLRSINSNPSEYFPKKSRFGGWAVNGIYGGSKGKRIDNPTHPWMVVKKGEKYWNQMARLLLAVDMGQFGLNNPYCGVVAWTEPNLSMNEIVQRIGRALRNIFGISSSDQYAVLVFGDDERIKARMSHAISYILNMEEAVTDSFVSLLDAIETPGGILVDVPPKIKFGNDVRYKVNEKQGNALPEILTEEEVWDVAKQFAEENEKSNDFDFVEDLAKQISDYVEKIQDEKFKDKEYGLPSSAQPLTFVFSEQCKDSFSLREMVAYANANYDTDDIVEIINDLESGRKSVVKMVTEELKRKHQDFHRPAEQYFSVQSLLGIDPNKVDNILNRGRDTYFGSLKEYFSGFEKRCTEQEKKTLRQVLVSCLYQACSYSFGLPGFGKEHYASFESQLSSAMCSPYVKTKILNQAKAFSIERLQKKMPGHHRLYLNQINQFLEAFNRGQKQKVYY